MNLIFPKTADRYIRIAFSGFLFAVITALTLFAYLSQPKVTDTGYSPVQPLPYSHKLHAGNLGMDCRYCHAGVESSARAGIPATEVCLNCHSRVKSQSPLLAKVRESYATGQPIPWVRVHRLPDYVYFNHAVHVKAGVSCVSCHGRVDQMAEVRQVQPLSMAWCLDCHRNPAAAIHIAPPANCSGCHR